MQRLPFRDSRVLSASLLLAIGLTLAACGGGGTSGTTPTTPAQSSATSAPVTPSGDPTTGAGAIAAIKSNWATFFDAKTPTARRLALLQNGPQFASVIKAQAGSQLALLATSQVTNVTLSGTNQAYVTYDILVGGKPALSGQQGVAVYQDGLWKVGDVSFCGLLKLENAGKTAGLPAACPH